MNPATRPGGPSALKGPWSLSQEVERTFAALAIMEKPVIARLNGNAYGFAMHAL
jgi:enoyl-CoA hydratase/carnithine racemase